MVGLCLQDGERRWRRGPSVPMTGGIWWGTTSTNAAFASSGSGGPLGDPCVRGRGNHLQGESPQLGTLTVDLPEPHGPPPGLHPGKGETTTRTASGDLSPLPAGEKP